MASDWLGAMLAANQMPDWKIVINQHGFNPPRIIHLSDAMFTSSRG